MPVCDPYKTARNNGIHDTAIFIVLPVLSGRFGTILNAAAHCSQIRTCIRLTQCGYSDTHISDLSIITDIYHFALLAAVR